MSAILGGDPYTMNDLTPRMTPGTIFDGVDSLGQPAKFRYVKHVNAVATVAGHCAVLAALPAEGTYTVTNDVAGGATTPIAGPIGVGVYLRAVTENYYCAVLVQGYHATALGDGSVAAGEEVTAKATDGTFDTDAGAALKVVGVCIEDDAGSPTTFKGIFNFL